MLDSTNGKKWLKDCCCLVEHDERYGYRSWKTSKNEDSIDRGLNTLHMSYECFLNVESSLHTQANVFSKVRAILRRFCNGKQCSQTLCLV